MLSIGPALVHTEEDREQDGVEEKRVELRVRRDAGPGGAGLDADQTACRGFFFKVSLSCLGLVLGYSNERPRRRVTGSDGWSQGESCCWRHTEIDVLVCRIFQYHERKTLFFVCTFLL